MIIDFNFSDIKFHNVINTVILTFSRLCELFEAESKKYPRKHLNTFDGHNQSRIDSTCVLGQLYETMINKYCLMIEVDIKINTNFDFIKEINYYIYNSHLY